MLVHVTSWSTKVGKLGVKFGVFDYVDGKSSVDFKPLGPFTPLGKLDLRFHVLIVAATAVWARVIERTDERVSGFEYVMVDDREVVERDAGFRN